MKKRKFTDPLVNKKVQKIIDDNPLKVIEKRAKNNIENFETKSNFEKDYDILIKEEEENNEA